MVLKQLVKETKGYRVSSALAPVGMLGEVIFETLIPLLIARIVDF